MPCSSYNTRLPRYTALHVRTHALRGRTVIFLPSLYRERDREVRRKEKIARGSRTDGEGLENTGRESEKERKRRKKTAMD